MSKLVPFKRNLVYKQVKTMEGRDVLAVSRCLHRLHYRWKEPTLAYGWQMRDNVQLYRRRQNMNPIGVYDQATHGHLAPEFDEYERWLYAARDRDSQPTHRRRRQADAQRVDAVRAAAVALPPRPPVHPLPGRPAHRVHVRLFLVCDAVLLHEWPPGSRTG